MVKNVRLLVRLPPCPLSCVFFQTNSYLKLCVECLISQHDTALKNSLQSYFSSRLCILPVNMLIPSKFVPPMIFDWFLFD